MNTQDQVFNFVQEYLRPLPPAEQQEGITAAAVAEHMGIWQNDAAAALNSLAASGLLQKRGSRPIHYCLKEHAKAGLSAPQPMEGDDVPAFQRMIGYNGSLKLQIQLAKAGASYPPYGMHMLILGESGVGKTLLAEEIWRYMNQNRPEGTPPKPFVIFNCAEYAENPQLLLSHLFGYEKGAFTGAEASSRGLIDEANGGVLLLDEIHRLQKTGQEMLFTLIDRGLYRRLGSTKDLHANLMIIGATTENPDSAFLHTFRRRIPIVIEIPSLKERPIKERLQLVFHFFKQESKRLEIPINISEHALSLLVSYHSNTNIGDLKNEIQLCCARGYLTFRSRQQAGEFPPYIEFHASNLSRHLQGITVPKSILKFLDSWIVENSLLVVPDTVLETSGSKTPNVDAQNTDIYDFLEQQIRKYSSAEAADSEPLASLDIQSKLNEYALSNHIYSSPEKSLHMFESVTIEVMATANELVRFASNEFNYVYPDLICNMVALYLQQIKFFYQANQANSTSDLQTISNMLTDQIRFVEKMLPMLNKTLHVQLTDDEVIVIALLLKPQNIQGKKHIGLIIMGHGSSTATSIAEFTNQVLITRTAYAIDIPISFSPEQILDKLYKVVMQINEGRGVIILTDTDNIEYYEKRLTEQTGIRCKVVPGLSTVMALELCKAILTTDDNIDTIIQYCTENYYTYITSALSRTGFDRQTAKPENPEHKNVILICCITGVGTARKIREWLLQFPAVYLNTEIIPIGVKENIHELAAKLQNRLKLIIGFMDPQIKGVPFIDMEQITSQEGVNRVTLILKGWCYNYPDVHWSQKELPLSIRFKQIVQRLDYFAPSVDPEAAIAQADYIVHSVNELLGGGLSDDLQIRMYMHTLAMFERLQTQEPLPQPESEAFIDTGSPAFAKIAPILEKACDTLGFPMPLSEIYYFLLVLPEEV